MGLLVELPNSVYGSARKVIGRINIISVRRITGETKAMMNCSRVETRALYRNNLKAWIDWMVVLNGPKSFNVKGSGPVSEKTPGLRSGTLRVLHTR